MYNQITVVGNVGRDPEMRYSRNGTPMVNFSVATNHRYNVTAEDGNREQREETNWFRISAFGNLAENCDRYVTKGMLVLVTGRLNLNQYTDNDGQPRASMEVSATTVKFLSSVQTQTEAEDANGGETPHVDAPPENPPSEGPVNRQGYGSQNNPRQEEGYGADGTTQPYGAPPNEQRYPNYPQRPNYGGGRTQRDGGQPQRGGGQTQRGGGQPQRSGGQPQYGGGYAQPSNPSPQDDWMNAPRN